MRKYKFAVLVLFAVFACVALTSCASWNKISEPESRALWFNTIYLNEYALYEKQVAEHNAIVATKPDSMLNDKELDVRNANRKLLGTKKRLLIELKGVLNAYNSFVSDGTVAPYELSQQATRIINDLLGLSPTGLEVQ